MSPPNFLTVPAWCGFPTAKVRVLPDVARLCCVLFESKKVQAPLEMLRRAQLTPDGSEPGDAFRLLPPFRVPACRPAAVCRIPSKGSVVRQKTQ
jgi:hypothetical protein